MAIPCQGFTFTWGTATLREMQTLQVNLQRGLPVGRTAPVVVSGTSSLTGPWSPKGEINLAGFDSTNFGTDEYGKRKRLTIIAPIKTTAVTATLTIFNADCVWRDMTIDATANGAVKFAWVLSLQDTAGAPSNP